MLQRSQTDEAQFNNSGEQELLSDERENDGSSEEKENYETDLSFS